VPSRINSTFGGNLIDMVRFRRILEIIRQEKLVENCQTVGSYLLKQLEGLQGEFPGLVSGARGRGLFCAIDLPDPSRRDRLRQLTYELGLILIGCGTRSIRFRPPIDLKTAEVDEGISAIRKSLQQMSTEKKEG
jgi:L-lysine 6-transaminase